MPNNPFKIPVAFENQIPDTKDEAWSFKEHPQIQIIRLIDDTAGDGDGDGDGDGSDLLELSAYI